MYQFTLAVIFRYLIGVGDAAVRNFIWLPNELKLYSVDDENWMGEKPQVNYYKSERTSMIRGYLIEKYESMIQPVVIRWKKSFEDNKIHFGKLTDFVENRFPHILQKDKVVVLFDVNK